MTMTVATSSQTPQGRRPLDVTKLDFEGNRLRRRRRLILWSLPVVVIITLLCIWLIIPYIATAQAASSVTNGNTAAAAHWLDALQTNIFYEKYKLPFNKALVATNDKRFDDADELYKEALASAPAAQQCFIHVQSVLSNELAGDNAVSEQKYRDAITYYTKSLAETTNYAACFKNYDALIDRINDKLAQAVYTLSHEDDTSVTKQTQTDSEDALSGANALPSQSQLDAAKKLRVKGEQQKQAENYSSMSDVYTEKGW